MQKLPDRVKTALERLKASFGKNLGVKVINGSYYVYQQSFRRDQIYGTVKNYTFYIGKIGTDGDFLKAKRRTKSRTKKIESFREYAKAREQESEDLVKGDEEIENLRILEEISTDARAPLDSVAKEVNLTKQMVKNRIKHLEKRFGIEYTAQISPLRLGFLRFMIMVKFKGSKRPDRNAIKRRLEPEAAVQLVALTKGRYDMIIYTMFPDIAGLESWLYNIRESDEFADYDSEWIASYSIGTGVRLRDLFFAEMLEKRVWQRSKEQPRKRSDQIFRREYYVLRTLNSNGKVHLKEIDNEYSMGRGVSNNTFKELKRSGKIERITISMKNPPVKYIAFIELHQNNIKYYKNGRKDFSFYIIKDHGIWSNKFIEVGSIGAPYGIFIVAPLYKDGELEDIEENLKRIFKKNRIESLILTEVLIGGFIINKIKRKELYDYKRLKDEYRIPKNEIERILNQK